MTKPKFSVNKEYDRIMYAYEFGEIFENDERLQFIDTSQDIAAVLEHVRLPRFYSVSGRYSVNAMYVLMGEGEYIAVWVTSESAYDNRSQYEQCRLLV